MSTPLAILPPPGSRTTLTTVVATIGPASQLPDLVRKLILAGVNVFRFNFSHGTEGEHTARLALVRQMCRELNQPVAVLGDLPGPKIRVTRVAEPGIQLQPGQDMLIVPGVPEAVPGRTPVLGATIGGLAAVVQPGHKVLINDGAIRLLCMDRQKTDPAEAIRCRVTVGGLVTSGKGINFPSSPLQVEALTPRDRQWAKWAVANELDYLALSFVRSAEDVQVLKRFLAELAPGDTPMPVIAKIEKPEAVANMASILQVCDAIMVARGDLGVETDVALVPVIQKELLACAGEWGKPCIVATQMLESMITASIPTRAEASDVANAIFDGADAVMLSGETAVGKHPVLVVETMKRIIAVAEERMAKQAGGPTPPRHDVERGYRTAVLAHAAWHAAKDYGAKLVAVWSEAGGSARYLSQTGFHIPIVAYSSSERATRRMQLLRGVTAVCCPRPQSLAKWNAAVDELVVRRGLAQAGDPVVLIAGYPLAQQGSPNTLALHRVGEPAGGFVGHG